MADDRHLEKSKVSISRQRINRFDEIWQVDVSRLYESRQSIYYNISKIQAGHGRHLKDPKNTKNTTSQKLFN